jgi:hypothetical protein
LPTAAEEYRVQRRRIAELVDARTGRLWRRMSAGDLDGAWAAQQRAQLAAVTAGQLLAAEAAARYVPRALEEQGIDPAGTALRPAGFAGVASDGRPLQGLLRAPLTEVKTRIGDGYAPDAALVAGGATLKLITVTQVADAGRAAAGVGITAHPEVTGWARALNPPSCARCTVLAGRVYRRNDGFLRHPGCDCSHHLVGENTGDESRTDPAAAVRAGQVTGLPKASRRAILDGADPAQVINATTRRGSLYTAGGKQYTREGGRRLRPTPDTIYRHAGDDRAEAVRLFRRHGYLTT